jgi:hypothetical protein
MARRVGRHEGERDILDEARSGVQLVLVLFTFLTAAGLLGSSVAVWIKLTACAVAAAVPTVLGFRVRQSSRTDDDAASSPPDPVA